jgi:pyridoxal phosphate enzyme (YggS family)
MNIKNNINNLKQNLPASCTLVAVSKTQSPETIQEAYDAGHRIFGENKVQELLPKVEALPRDIAWHLIGHLQSNKVKYVVPVVHLIHSVDSLKLLEEINKQSAKINRVTSCLLQLHIAKEETKFGFSEAEVLDLLADAKWSDFTHVRVVGLMGMASFTDNVDQVRKEFRGLKKLFVRLKGMNLPAAVEMTTLSMGMSGDYSVALEEGSTMIRVGSAIFGNRNH